MLFQLYSFVLIKIFLLFNKITLTNKLIFKNHFKCKLIISLLGYNPEMKLIHDENLNVTDTEKQVIHQHYGTINQFPHLRISRERFYSFKMEVLLIKYTVLLLSLLMIVFDVRNIRNRIITQEDIISEVNIF